jgi:hypothetical protein
MRWTWSMRCSRPHEANRARGFLSRRRSASIKRSRTSALRLRSRRTCRRRCRFHPDRYACSCATCCRTLCLPAPTTFTWRRSGRPARGGCPSMTTASVLQRLTATQRGAVLGSRSPAVSSAVSAAASSWPRAPPAARAPSSSSPRRRDDQRLDRRRSRAPAGGTAKSARARARNGCRRRSRHGGTGGPHGAQAAAGPDPAGSPLPRRTATT